MALLENNVRRRLSLFIFGLKAYKTSNDNLAAIPSGIPETLHRL
jgi:hypothetical protein